MGQQTNMTAFAGTNCEGSFHQACRPEPGVGLAEPDPPEPRPAVSKVPLQIPSVDQILHRHKGCCFGAVRWGILSAIAENE